MNVTRYSDISLSDYQKLVIDEATKLSYACRMFRYIFGRWPSNIDEIMSKTNGIDFEVFKGTAVVTPVDNDSAQISVFDGVNTLSVQATPVDFDLPESYKSHTNDPAFKIDVGSFN